jgi:HSP20 family protein
MNQLSTRRVDPLSGLFDEFFNDFFQRAGVVPASRLANAPAVSRARMDVVDKGEAFEVKLDLPGVKKDDIQVSVEGSRIAISAEAKDSRETRDGAKVLYSERFVSSYARSFELPAEVTEEGADARFENGVLTLTLPKRAPIASKRLTIK